MELQTVVNLCQAIFDVVAVLALIAQTGVNRAQIRFNGEVIESLHPRK